MENLSDDTLYVKLFDIDDTLTTGKNNHYVEKKNDTWKWKKTILSPEKNIFEILKNKEKYRPPNSDIEECFSEFRDGYPHYERTFPKFIKTCIENWEIWPMWQECLKSIIAWEIVGLITDRGHASKNLKNGLFTYFDELGSHNDKAHFVQNIRKKYPFLNKYTWGKINFTQYLDNYLSIWEAFRYVGVHNREEFFDPFGLENIDMHTGERKAYLFPYIILWMNQLKQKYFPYMKKLHIDYYDNHEGILYNIEKNIKKLEETSSNNDISIGLHDQYGNLMT